VDKLSGEFRVIAADRPMMTLTVPNVIADLIRRVAASQLLARAPIA